MPKQHNTHFGFCVQSAQVFRDWRDLSSEFELKLMALTPNMPLLPAWTGPLDELPKSQS